MLTSKERTCEPCSLAYNCCLPSLWLAEVLGLSNRASLGGGNFTLRDYELSTVVGFSKLGSSCTPRLAKYGRRGDEDPPTALGSFLGPGEHTQNQRPWTLHCLPGHVGLLVWGHHLGLPVLLCLPSLPRVLLSAK